MRNLSFAAGKNQRRIDNAEDSQILAGDFFNNTCGDQLNFTGRGQITIFSVRDVNL
jgi:hypothetical protein